MRMPTTTLSLLVASTSITSSWLAQKPSWPLHLPSAVLPHSSEHFPTAFPFPHPQLTGHCQPLCNRGSLLTTSSIQETLGSQVLVQVPIAPPQPIFHKVRKPRELQRLRLGYPRHSVPKLDYNAGAVGFYRCAASRYSAPRREVQQLPGRSPLRCSP